MSMNLRVVATFPVLESGHMVWVTVISETTDDRYRVEAVNTDGSDYLPSKEFDTFGSALQHALNHTGWGYVLEDERGDYS